MTCVSTGIHEYEVKVSKPKKKSNGWAQLFQLEICLGLAEIIKQDKKSFKLLKTSSENVELDFEHGLYGDHTFV